LLFPLHLIVKECYQIQGMTRKREENGPSSSLKRIYHTRSRDLTVKAERTNCTSLAGRVVMSYALAETTIAPTVAGDASKRDLDR
jgi:hypothetical protein